MAVLLTDREQYELRSGGNALGGAAPDSIPLAQLSAFPLAGSITVRSDAPPTIQRLSSGVPLMVDGVMLGATPAPLMDSAVIQVGSVRMTFYETAAAAAAAAPDVPLRRKQSDCATQVMSAIGAPTRPAALIALETGTMVKLPSRDVVVGRSEDADVVLTGKGVSRRHAMLCAEGSGYALLDESTNGTFINGERLKGRTPLKAGDTIAFGDEQYRFDYVDAALAARLVGAAGATGASAPTSLAELEVVRGRTARKVYPIDRAVCAIGRSPSNDVSIEDESISASHATLLLKGETWYVTDLRSASGTYLDGYRVAGERALAAGSMIRIGQVAMVFRPTAGRRPEPKQRSGRGVLRRIARVLFS